MSVYLLRLPIYYRKCLGAHPLHFLSLHFRAGYIVLNKPAITGFGMFDSYRIKSFIMKKIIETESWINE